MRPLWIAALAIAAPGAGLHSQDSTASRLDWWSADSDRVAFVTAHGQAYRHPQVIVWAPTDSLDPVWLPHFVDSLAENMAALRGLIGGPHPWQRIGNRPVVFFFSPGRFISHATGQDTVFIALTHIRRGVAPFLHEAAHELLVPAAPFYPFEYPDSTEGERRAAHFPFWLSEGLADYLAQAVAGSTGFHEGDIFTIGGLDKVDSTCAARVASHPRREEILARVGDQGRLEALYTTERGEVAPTYYACSQAFTKYLVQQVGVPVVVKLFPAIRRDDWLQRLEAAAGMSLPAIRRAWLTTLRLERTLHLGAQVRVKVPKIDAGWIDGTIVGAKGSPTCFAVRLEHTDAQGRQQYAYLAAVTELQVDRRTNTGTLTVGLPPAAAEDWEAWSKADLAAAAARCRR